MKIVFYFFSRYPLKNGTRRLPCAQWRGTAEWQIMVLSGVWLWHIRSHPAPTSQPSISTFQMLFLKFSLYIPSHTNRSVFLHVFYLMWHHGLTKDSITTIPANTSTFLMDSVSRICDEGNLTAKGQQFERQALEFGITVKKCSFSCQVYKITHAANRNIFDGTYLIHLSVKTVA